MSVARISRIEVQGFRAFGRTAQTPEFPSLLAAVWGPNSQGKTSFAEAIEFLLTGQIVRRELMASSQDEFADALRNAHLPFRTPAYVEAQIIAPGGSTHTVRRTLKSDYGKKSDCESTLQIDGKPAAESGLAALGINLSQPPLRAPVLAQHTLGYLFSARPQDRAAYFKAILEVTDLDAFRGAVAELEKGLDEPADPLVGKLECASEIPQAHVHLSKLLSAVPAAAELAAALENALEEIIVATGADVPPGVPERATKLSELLADKRAKTFPLSGFDHGPRPSWSGGPVELVDSLTAYLAERSKVDDEARKLIGLFREALALPATLADGAVDCPLCGAEDTLTPERTAFIRQQVSDTEAFQNAEKGAKDSLARLLSDVDVADRAIRKALPAFFAGGQRARYKAGFRMERIHSLLGQDAVAPIKTWLTACRATTRAATSAVLAIRAIRSQAAGYADNLETLTRADHVATGLERASNTLSLFARALDAYDAAEADVKRLLQSVVDAQSKTEGWQDVIDLANDLPRLLAVLVDRAARESVRKELAQALKQIDKGNEAVLDEKFQTLSAGVQIWWDLLRPDELSFLSAIGARPGARRTIDFKAGLAISPDRSDTKLRDVIAVFSQSQLHCLGLALFLARAVEEGAGFIVLDDPILTSDEDYSAYFTAQVVEKLIGLGIQVIVLTQNERTWKDLGERYLHIGIAQFQIVLLNPADGATLTNTADDLETAFTHADILIRGGHADLRKRGGEKIRDTAERFCKEMLVKNRRAAGDASAVLSDYDHNTLGELAPKVEPLLTLDPSHPGKLRAIGGAVNPAKHDAPVPATATLKVALGDLRDLKRRYL